MTKSHLGIWLVAVVSAGLGIPSAVGSFVMEDVTPLFRVASFVVGALLVVGAYLLVIERRVGVALLWLSATLYALLMLVPAFERHGLAAFTALMGAFYLSMAIRLGLAVAAHMVMQGRRHG